MKTFIRFLFPVFFLLGAQLSLGQQDSWTINFKNADISQFIDEIATMTGRTIVLEPRVAGSVTVSSDQPLDSNGVWNVFRAVMRAHSFEVVQTDGIYTVISTAIARTFGGTREGLSPDRDNQLVTEVVHLTHVSSVEIVKLARNISPNYGHLAASQSPNVVIITDYADNARAIVDLIHDLDQPAEVELKVIKLQETLVVDMADMLETLDIGVGTGDSLRVLANENSNSLVLRGSPHEVSEIEKVVHALDIASDQRGNTRVFYLRFAEATAIADLIKEIVPEGTGGADGSGTGSADTGKVSADEKQNAIVVHGNQAFITDVEELIRQLDIRRAQALIEAAVVEITVSDSDNLSIEFGVADNASDRTPVATTSVGGLLTTVFQRLQDAQSNDNEVRASDALAAVNTPAISIAKLDPTGISFGAIMNALSTQTEANFLSTPHITAVDNAQSEIIVGQEIPIRTGSIHFQNTDAGLPRTQTARKKIGVELKVTPFINHDGTIRMEVEQKVENVLNPELGIGDSGFADVVTSVREIKTEVIAENRQTIVLGGLLGEDETSTLRKVPGLGSIPLIGRLFQSKSKTKSRRHLLVFIRPTVLESPSEILAENQRKFRPIWEVSLDGTRKQEGDESVREPPPLEAIFDGKQN